jgi:hypothetical protein
VRREEVTRRDTVRPILAGFLELDGDVSVERRDRYETVGEG